jgi:hypothetical protein
MALFSQISRSGAFSAGSYQPISGLGDPTYLLT